MLSAGAVSWACAGALFTTPANTANTAHSVCRATCKAGNLSLTFGLKTTGCVWHVQVLILGCVMGCCCTHSFAKRGHTVHTIHCHMLVFEGCCMLQVPASMLKGNMPRDETHSHA